MPPRLAYAPRAGSKPDDGGLVAVLGPTNTGKTFFAIERMLAHRSGMIGLPLRLLAREVYDKLAARVGPREVALVTGEEKITPPNARYWVSTVEAMPLERDVEFLAIDEVQLAADMERGRIFTSRILNARGARETVFLGSSTMRQILKKLFPSIELLGRERLSALAYAGSKKVTRLPRRTAIVGFSADTVYAIAELVRRQRGGAAVVLGALSPRTRNAQADLYQSGDVDYLIATDAIGMGLNMDIDHVAFAARRKFDGRRPRDLRSDELAQIAGRAGRHIKNGTFGVTANCPDLDDEIVGSIEEHQFQPVDALQWRSDRIDFTSIQTLRRSLDAPPAGDLLRRARPGEDEIALERLCGAPEIRDRTTSPAATALLWDVCQIPDFRKSAFDHHARLLADVYEQLRDDGRVGEQWLAPKVDQLARTDGDIDAISTRIAHIRTWTFLANRGQWVENAPYWQGKTRSIEDSLSDALHEKLTQRFVDRRTSVLLKKLRGDAPLLAGVTEDGDVIVEGQFVGRLLGFEFIIDPRAKGAEAKRVRAAADRALAPLLAARAASLATAEPSDLTLNNDGTIGWRQSNVAALQKGPTPLRPNIAMRGLDAVTPSLRGRVQDRLADFLAARIEALLGDLLRLKTAADAASDDKDDDGLNGLARGVAFRLVENFGAMSRAPIAAELKQLQQSDRAKLRKLGVRFGEFSLYMPSLLKPGPARLLTLLWALWTDRAPGDFAPPKPGLVSIAADENVPHAYYYAGGYRPSGDRAVRIDMLERLAGLIRTAREAPGGREGFEATPQMMSLVGCSGEEFESILRSLGFRKHKAMRKMPAPAAVATDPESATAAPAEPASNVVAADAGETDKPTNVEASPAEPPAAEQATPLGQKDEAQEDDAQQGAAAPPSPDNPPEIGADRDSESERETPEESGAASEPTPFANGVDAAAISDTGAAQSGGPSPEGDGAAGSVDESQSGSPAADPATNGDGVIPMVDVEVDVWRMQPRRPPGQGRRPRRDEAGENRSAKGSDGGKGQQHARRGEKPGGRPGDERRGPPKHKRRHGKTDGPPREPRRYESGPKRTKGPDPDSPFAVLAALKNDGKDDGAE